MKNSKTPKKLIAFSFGSIGEFLMLLNICYFIKKSDPDFKAIVFSTRSCGFLKEIAGKYDFVAVRPMSFWNLIKALITFETAGSVILTPFSFGKTPSKILYIEKIIKFLSFSKIVGFCGLDYGDHVKKTGVVFDQSINFDLNELFYRNILNVLRKAGFSFEESELSFFYDTQELKNLNKDYIVIHIMASNEKRSLPLERWKNILSALSDYGLTICLTGSKADKDKLFPAMAGLKNVCNLAGEISFYELASLIKGSRVFVGVDTGVTHLAGVLNAVGVIVGNNSNPTWLPYYNRNFKVLMNKQGCTCTKDKGGGCLIEINEKKYCRCMYDVPDEKIIKEIKDSYDKNTG